MSKRITLTALAKECDVSIGAVSRILSGDKTLKVRDSVRQRVVETAAKLNYRPNAAAQNLAILAVQGCWHFWLWRNIDGTLITRVDRA